LASVASNLTSIPSRGANSLRRRAGQIGEAAAVPVEDENNKTGRVSLFSEAPAKLATPEGFMLDLTVPWVKTYRCSNSVLKAELYK